MEHKTINKHTLFSGLNPVNSGSKALFHHTKQAYELVAGAYKLKNRNDWHKLFKSNFIGIN